MARNSTFPPHYFPWLGSFKTMEEVNEYFDQDTLTCLICGKECHSLHKHVAAAHGLPADEYKELYDIPWTRGLISSTLREKQAAIMNQQRADGIIPHSPSPEHLAKLCRVGIKNRRPITQAARNANSKHALSEHGRTERWGKKDCEEYLRRIKTGRTVTEVGKDPDMPCREVFDTYKRENPAFDQKFEKAWNALPFSLQARAQRTGERFRQRLVELRLQNFTWPHIARIMDVKEGTVRSGWHRLKHNGELEGYIKEYKRSKREKSRVANIYRRKGAGFLRLPLFFSHEAYWGIRPVGRHEQE